MKNKVNIVTVNPEYCNYLRQFEPLIPFNYNDKSNRPYVGIVFQVNDCDYFAPLTSPKKKHLKMKNSLDFYKLENRYFDKNKQKEQKELIGAINFNNMLPLTENNYTPIDLNKKCTNLEEKKYMELLKIDFKFINDNIDTISKRAKTLYNLYITGRLDNKFFLRCCDFTLLEIKCMEYNKDF